MNINIQGSKKKNRWFIVGLAIVLILVFIAGALLWKQRQEESQQTMADETVSQVTVGNETNTITYEDKVYERNREMKAYLFMGIDKEADMSSASYFGSGGQADAIVLMAANTKKKTLQVFQISRNTMANIRIYSDKGEYLTTQKAQLALQYAYGDGKNKSIQLMKDTVSELLYQVPITGATAMSMEGLSTITNLLGGVEVTMPKNYTNIDITFEQGKELTLMGEQAERFVRYRDTSVTGSNQDRMERQTYFVMSLLSKYKGLAAKEQDLGAKLLDNVKPYIATDMTAEQLMDLSDFEMIEELQILSGEERPGMDYDEFYVNEEHLKEIVIDTFYNQIDK